MVDLKIGDVRYYKKVPVTVKSIRDAGYAKFITIQWFVGDELNEKEVHNSDLLTLPEYPNYNDYIDYLRKHDMLDEGASDGFEELMLNETITTLERVLAKYNIPHHEMVDAVYEVIHERSDSFQYYVDCVLAEGYEMATQEAKHLNEEVGQRMMKDVLEAGKERGW